MMTAAPAAMPWTRPLAGIAYGKFHGPATTTTREGVHRSPAAASSSCCRVRWAAYRAKSMASETSGSPSATVLPAVCAISARVRPRSASMRAATASRVRRRSCQVLAVQADWAARARATSRSTSSGSVRRAGSPTTVDASASAAQTRLTARVKSVSGAFLNVPSADPRVTASGRAWVRREVVDTACRAPTDARKRSASRCQEAEPGVMSNSDFRKFSGAEFSSSRRER